MGKTLSFEESGEAVYAAMVKVQYDVYNVHVHVGTCIYMYNVHVHIHVHVHVCVIF